MLEFNPHFRCSAKELMKKPVFDNIRVPQLEEEPHSKIVADPEVENFYQDLREENRQEVEEFLLVKLIDEVRMTSESGLYQ